MMPEQLNHQMLLQQLQPHPHSSCRNLQPECLIIETCRPSRHHKYLNLRAVHIKPPVTDEILLVEESTIRTQEAVLGQITSTKVSTNVEGLTLSFWVSIVSLYKAITQETGFWRSSKDGIIFSRGAGDGLFKS